MFLCADILGVCEQYLGEEGAAYVNGREVPIVYAAQEGLLDVVTPHGMGYMFAKSLRTIKYLYLVLKVRFEERPHYAVQSLEILQWLMARGEIFTGITQKCVAFRGDAEMLRALRPTNNFWMLEYASAHAGSIGCLEVLRDCGHTLGDEVSRGAATGGHVHVLEFAWANKIPFAKDAAQLAAENGHVRCLELAMRYGPTWDAWPMRVVGTGKLAIVQFMHARGMQFDERCCTQAATCGLRDIVRFLLDSGCEYSAQTCAAAARQNDLDAVARMRDKWDARTCAMAAQCPDGKLLRYAHSNGCEWDANTCSAAAALGNLDNIIYARSNGCDWDEQTCTAAANHGNLSLLKYLVEAGCPWDQYTCFVAVTKGRFDMLRYALTQGCPLTPFVFETAASVGNLEAFRLLHEHGCPYDTNALYRATASNDRIELLRYMLDHTDSFPLGREVGYHALDRGQFAVVRLLLDRAILQR